MCLAQWEINDKGMVLAHKGLPILGEGEKLTQRVVLELRAKLHDASYLRWGGQCSAVVQDASCQEAF